MVTSLRERKKRATRVALRRAAVELVAERGSSDVTIEEIAAAADVSTRTFFNYFASKEDAVVGWDPERLDELVAALAEQNNELSAFDALREVLLEALGKPEADSDELLKRLAVLRSDPRLFANHAAHWAETERGLAEAVARRRRPDAVAKTDTDTAADTAGSPAASAVATRDRYAALLVAAAMSTCRVAMLSWCEDGGREPLHDVLAAHLLCLSEGLPEQGRLA
jgi:AcrR family transcriptional regulator